MCPQGPNSILSAICIGFKLVHLLSTTENISDRMSLWSEVKSLFRDHGERVWVRFYDRRNTEENRVLTLKDVDECSASIVEVG